MTSTQSDTHAAVGFEPLIEINMEIDVFGSDWWHCDHISSYLARMVSHNRTDSLLYSNLFSSAVNELLETVYRAHSGPGAFTCSVSRHGAVDRIELTLPCGAQDKSFYEGAIDAVHGPDAGDRYRNVLLSPGPIDPSIGLLELAVDYDAKLKIETLEGNAVRLTAELALEETGRS